MLESATSSLATSVSTFSTVFVSVPETYAATYVSITVGSVIVAAVNVTLVSFGNGVTVSGVIGVTVSVSPSANAGRTAILAVRASAVKRLTNFFILSLSFSYYVLFNYELREIGVCAFLAFAEYSVLCAYPFALLCRKRTERGKMLAVCAVGADYLCGVRVLLCYDLSA